MLFAFQNSARHSKQLLLLFNYITGVPYISANIYCKSRNLPNTDTQNYSTDFRLLLGYLVSYDYCKFTGYVKNLKPVSYHFSNYVKKEFLITEQLQC